MRGYLLNLLFLLILLPLSSQGASSVEPIQVTGAELLEFGAVRHYGLGFSAPPHTKERHYEVVAGFKLLKAGDVIPAALGTAFGIHYVVTGSPQKSEVELQVEVIHPPTKSKNGKTSTHEQTKQTESIGEPTYSDLYLDVPSSVVPGQWTFRVSYQSKVLLEKSFQVVEARQLAESEAVVVDDVPVFGRVDVVSESDIREAIKEATDNSSSEPKKPSALEVITADEIRAYRPERALGWVPLRLQPFIEPDGSQHLTWGMWSFTISD